MRFDAFFVSAAVTLAPEPTLVRPSRILGRLPEVRRPEVHEANPFALLYELARAREILVFTPEHGARGALADPAPQAS